VTPEPPEDVTERLSVDGLISYCRISALKSDMPFMNRWIAKRLQDGRRDSYNHRQSLRRRQTVALKLVGSKQVQVNERDWDVNTHLQVEQGDTLILHAWGQIWAGVWLTGNNGPKGWDNVDNNTKFPLPGSHPFGLLGKLDTGYFYVGEFNRIDQATDSGTLFLRINDEVPGNGNGAFQCIVQVYRDM
jgi:hypothetical protein